LVLIDITYSMRDLLSDVSNYMLDQQSSDMRHIW